MNVLYLSPASPFLLCFVVLGMYCGVMVLVDLMAPRRLKIAVPKGFDFMLGETIGNTVTATFFLY